MASFARPVYYLNKTQKMVKAYSCNSRPNELKSSVDGDKRNARDRFDAQKAKDRAREAEKGWREGEGGEWVNVPTPENAKGGNDAVKQLSIVINVVGATGGLPGGLMFAN
jgi:hypothetical protein